MWVFNVFLYMMFLAAQGGTQGAASTYQAFVQSGSPCYAWVGGGVPDTPQPNCWYDPSNTNSGEGQ